MGKKTFRYSNVVMSLGLVPRWGLSFQLPACDRKSLVLPRWDFTAVLQTFILCKMCSEVKAYTYHFITVAILLWLQCCSLFQSPLRNGSVTHVNNTWGQILFLEKDVSWIVATAGVWVEVFFNGNWIHWMRRIETYNIMSSKLESSNICCLGQRDAVEDAQEMTVTQKSPYRSEGRLFS